ncbi:unnamed protein product [Rotaria socialis]
MKDPKVSRIQVVTTDLPWTKKQVLSTIARILVNLNLFKTAKRVQVRDLKQQRWSTHLFIILLCTVILIITTYNDTNKITRTIIANNPSLDSIEEWQADSYIASSLQCPCSQISSPYESFIHLTVKYHQICSSDFISSRWIISLEDAADPLAVVFVADLSFHSDFFELLGSLCTFANNPISSTLTGFSNTQLVTAALLVRQVFDYQMNSVAEFFIQSTINNFLRLIHILSNVTEVNQFITNAYSNFDVELANVSYESSNIFYPYLAPSTFIFIGNQTVSCFCITEISCKIQIGVYITASYAILLYPIPGMFTGCIPMSSLLISTLECFYDDSDCLSQTDKTMERNLSSWVTHLDSHLPSQFLQNTTINVLLEHMFLEVWTINSSFERYFNACAVQSCLYMILENYAAIEIITILFGLIGGISKALIFTVPFFLMLVFFVIDRFHRHRGHQPQSTEENQTERGYSPPTKAVENECDIRLQRLATKIYTILLLLALVILIFYSSLTYTTNIKIANISSVDDYVKLANEYKNLSFTSNFECLCQKLSIVRSSYIQKLEPSLHDIFSPTSINDEWLGILFDTYAHLDYSQLPVYTFQGTALPHYQALKAMCNLVQETVYAAQTLFLNSALIILEITDQDAFEKDTNEAIEQFQQNIPNTFIHLLQLQLAYVPVTDDINAQPAIISYEPQYYGECNCATTATCTQQLEPVIPGYVVGCSPLEALLQSTIECHYDASCIQSVYLYTTSFDNVTDPIQPLNYSHTRFLWNSTIATLLENMFIESWSSNISYNNFFQQCHPSTCSSALIQRFNLLYMFTTIFGIYGGLSTILQLISPSIAKFLYKFFLRHRIQMKNVETVERQNTL